MTGTVRVIWLCSLLDGTGRSVWPRGDGLPAAGFLGTVMRDQLQHLARMSRQPNITVGIVPYSAGAHSGLAGAFAIAEFTSAPAIVYLETAAEGQVAEAPSMVAQVMLTFDTLRSEGLPRGASRDLIMKVAEERWT